jgi:hypothetical protein
MSYRILLRKLQAMFSCESELGQVVLRIYEFERMKRSACQYVAKGHLQIRLRILIFDYAV